MIETYKKTLSKWNTVDSYLICFLSKKISKTNIFLIYQFSLKGVYPNSSVLLNNNYKFYKYLIETDHNILSFGVFIFVHIK